MAFSSSQPLLLLLAVASIFFLPALCVNIDFEYCNKSGYDFGNITRVEYSPRTGMLTPSYLDITGYAKNFYIKTVYVSLKLATSKTVPVRGYDYVRPYDSNPSTGYYRLQLDALRGSYITGKDTKITISYIDESGKTVMCFEYGQVFVDKSII